MKNQRAKIELIHAQTSLKNIDQVLLKMIYRNPGDEEILFALVNLSSALSSINKMIKMGEETSDIQCIKKLAYCFAYATWKSAIFIVCALILLAAITYILC